MLLQFLHKGSPIIRSRGRCVTNRPDQAPVGSEPLTDAEGVGSHKPKSMISVGQQHIGHNTAWPAKAYELRHQKGNPACEILLRGCGVVGCKQPKFCIKGSTGLARGGDTENVGGKATNCRVVHDAKAELGVRHADVD